MSRTEAGGGGTPPRRARPRWIASLLLAAGSLVVFGGLLELFAYRAQSDVPPRLAQADTLAITGLEIPDPELFWRYRPHADIAWKSIRVQTNAFGLRDRARTREKPPGVYRILSLGESTTFGDRLEAEQSYSYQLEEILNADAPSGRRVEVWNCGVCSYTSYQSLRWLERDGFSLEPDLVLFYHEMNDFLPTYHRSGDGRALGLGRSDRELGEARRRLGPLVALLERSHFYRWLRLRVLLAASQALAPALERRERAEQAANAYDEAIKHRMPWGLVPLPKGDPTAWPAALPYMANPNPACRVPDADRRALLDELVGAVRERGVGLVLIHPAYRNSRPHRCVLTEIARRRGVRVVEFERIVRAMGAPKHEVFIDVFHPTAQAHRRLAEELARVVRPLIESPPQGRRSARARPPRRRPARAGRALQGAQRLR